jgi:hypothetical protein
VLKFGSLIHIHIAVIGRENDGMLSPRFVKRQARDKDMRIDKHDPEQMGVVVVAAPASCTLQRTTQETAYEGKVTYGNSQDVVARCMALRCICACMHRVVGWWEVPPSLEIIPSKLAGQ